MNRYAAIFFARVSLTDFSAGNPVVIVGCDCEPPRCLACPSNFRRRSTSGPRWLCKDVAPTQFPIQYLQCIRIRYARTKQTKKQRFLELIHTQLHIVELMTDNVLYETTYTLTFLSSIDKVTRIVKKKINKKYVFRTYTIMSTNICRKFWNPNEFASS